MQLQLSVIPADADYSTCWWQKVANFQMHAVEDVGIPGGSWYPIGYTAVSKRVEYCSPIEYISELKIFPHQSQPCCGLLSLTRYFL